MISIPLSINLSLERKTVMMTGSDLLTLGNILLIFAGIFFVASLVLCISASAFKETPPKLFKSLGLASSAFLLTGAAMAIYTILLAWLPIGWWTIAGTIALTLVIAVWTVIKGKKFETEEWEKERFYVVLLLIIGLILGSIAIVSLIIQHSKLLILDRI